MEDEQKQQASLEGQFPGENEQKKQKALKNKPERRRMLLLFMLSFLVLLVGIGSAGAFTLLSEALLSWSRKPRLMIEYFRSKRR